MWFLSADIGGTRTRLLAIEYKGDQELSRVEKEYHSQQHPDLLSILTAFIQEHGISHIHAACLAVAGPVRQGVAKVTNLPWVISESELSQALSINTVKPMNDFSGVAYGINELGIDDVQTLQVAQADPDGDILVLGAGTGLGMAIITRCDHTMQVMETEAGHMGFSPNDDEELEIMAYWKTRLQRVTNETFLSGIGITRIFEFYRTQSNKPPNNELMNEIERAGDPAKVINDYARTYKEPAALKTMQRFAAIYASVAADMALATKASGGVYLAGGIAPASLNFLQTDQFIEIFNNKPPMNVLLATVPVKVIMNTSVGLLGAMAVARSFE